MVAVAAAGCSDLLFEPVDDMGAPAQYDELWTIFDEGYAPFVARGVDWEAAGARHRPAGGAGDAELFESMTALLAELDDGHVTLVAPGRPAFVAQESFREDRYAGDFDLGIILSRMSEGPLRSGAARYGVLPDELGYVHVANWSDPIPDLDGVLERFAGLRGVIVDLRHNPGGDFTNGFPFAARFADRARLAFTTLTKTGPEPDALGQQVEWMIEPAGGPRYDGPVVVLSNGYTNSAAERTLMAFRVLPQVTVVGSRTAGNHGEKVGGELSNGWTYSIVPQVVTAADGASYEGPGIPPDVAVDNSADEVTQGMDRQFEAAVALLSGGG
jgi:hypothetical protein